jgi:hypothetical protein
MNDVSQVQAARREGESDAQRRQDYYGQRPGMGVPAGTTGADPEPLALPEDRAVAGTGGGR